MQQKKIKVLKSKIQILEKSLGQIVEDFEKEKELVRFQHEQIIKEQKEEIVNLREMMRSRNIEAKHVKALSQVILDQRSDVEQFFLEALEQIKEEIRKKIAVERKQRKLGTMGIQNALQATHSQIDPEGSQTQNKSYADKVDLNDLDWEDRERVLRLLFSKMNAGVPANASINNDIGEVRGARAQKMGSILEEERMPALEYD